MSKTCCKSYKTENNLVSYKVDKLKDQKLKAKSARYAPINDIYGIKGQQERKVPFY